MIELANNRVEVITEKLFQELINLFRLSLPNNKIGNQNFKELVNLLRLSLPNNKTGNQSDLPEAD